MKEMEMVSWKTRRNKLPHAVKGSLKLELKDEVHLK